VVLEGGSFFVLLLVILSRCCGLWIIPHPSGGGIAAAEKWGLIEFLIFYFGSTIDDPRSWQLLTNNWSLVFLRRMEQKWVFARDLY